MTKQTVKTIARAFNFSAKFDKDCNEWTIASKRYPSDTYYTDDNDDAVGTILVAYRFYRSHNLILSIIQND